MEGVGPHDIDHGMVVGADGVAKAQPREAELEEEGEGEDGRGVGADELEQTFWLLSIGTRHHLRHVLDQLAYDKLVDAVVVDKGLDRLPWRLDRVAKAEVLDEALDERRPPERVHRHKGVHLVTT